MEMIFFFYFLVDKGLNDANKVTNANTVVYVNHEHNIRRLPLSVCCCLILHTCAQSSTLTCMQRFHSIFTVDL